MVFVKICGITNLEDALAALGAGADALGFNFYSRSSRFITPAAARLIIRELPAEALPVGVFVNESEPSRVERIADEAGIRAVQLHGDESPAYCRALSNRFVIKALRVREDFEPESVLEYETDAILLDAFDRDARGGTGRVIDWQLARRTCELVPKLFLAGGLTIQNVAEAISAARPYAVDACSGLECEPGRKDARLVQAFIKAAKG
ncbi:MAG TPA: phosphoribosylanthranilate isomerase [Pyrinomonadaceae bacterium]|nr:phosphoribosylanthranilate isomerase [Pyrinomonadaceae bacterium]